MFGAYFIETDINALQAWVEFGITTPTFRRGCRGSKPDGGSKKVTTPQFSLGQQIREHEVRALLFTRRAHGYSNLRQSRKWLGGTQ